MKNNLLVKSGLWGRSQRSKTAAIQQYQTPDNVQVWLMLGLASAATALLRHRFHQSCTDDELPQPLKGEKGEGAENAAESTEQHSIQPENSEKENLAPALTLSSIVALAVGVSNASDTDHDASADSDSHGSLPQHACASPPSPAELPAEMSLREKYSVVGSESAAPLATAAVQHCQVHVTEAAEPVGQEDGSTSDADAAAPVDTDEVSGSAPHSARSARQSLDAAGCAPRARFWKHKGFDPALSRATDAMNLDSPTHEPTADNTACAFSCLLWCCFALCVSFILSRGICCVLLHIP